MVTRKSYFIVILAVIAIIIVPGYAQGKCVDSAQKQLNVIRAEELVCNSVSYERNRVNYSNMNNSDKNKVKLENRNREQVDGDKAENRFGSKVRVSEQSNLRERIRMKDNEIIDDNTTVAGNKDNKFNRYNLEGYYDDFKQQPNKPVTKLEFLKCLVRIAGWENEVITSELSSEQMSLLKKIPDREKCYVAVAMNNDFIFEKELKTFNPNQGIKKMEAYQYLSRLSKGDSLALKNDSGEDVADETIPHHLWADISIPDELYSEFSVNSMQVMKRKDLIGFLDRLNSIYTNISFEESIKGKIDSVKVISGGYEIKLDSSDGVEVTVKTNEMTKIINGERMYDLDFKIGTGERVLILSNDEGYAYLIKLLPNIGESEQ